MVSIKQRYSLLKNNNETINNDAKSIRMSMTSMISKDYSQHEILSIFILKSEFY